MDDVITKKRNPWASDEDNGEDCAVDAEDESTLTPQTIPTQYAIRRVVVSVSLVGTTRQRIVKFGLIELEATGGRYTTQTYDVSTRNGTAGLFQMLDDYYMRRFRFFHSSRTVQAFMLALVDAEELFRLKHGISLFDHCKAVNAKAAGIAVARSDTAKASGFPLSKGYGITEEMVMFEEEKQKAAKPKWLASFGSDVVASFAERLEEMERSGYCAAIVNTFGSRRCFFIDPVVHLPIISYHPKFTAEISKVCSMIILASKGAVDREIDEVVTSSILLMPNATVGALLSVCDQNGIIKEDFSADAFPFAIGEYDTVRYTRDDVDGSKLNTIVGYT